MNRSRHTDHRLLVCRPCGYNQGFVRAAGRLRERAADTMLYYLIATVYVVTCLVLLLVVLLQQGKGGDIASAFGGSGSQTAFGARSGATLLSRVTTVCAALFMVGALALAVIGQRGPGSVVGSAPPPAPVSTPAQPAPAQTPPAQTPPAQETAPQQNAPAAPQQ